MNAETQVVILALVVIVPVALFWAFKTKPNDKHDAVISSEKKKIKKKYDFKKDTHIYDTYILQRYGKRVRRHGRY
ncbi:hypothetical protein [Candidatus Enterovibrio escicola]|uniref:hypothetical protein n=1 Tax=Candidatus Enterovibrio escicola TaxID=1927127 RepID=UPI001237F88E|nr:hypothetical protein [Candidatus Enterovibrio escacola]